MHAGDPEGRGTAWLADYDASSPDVLAGLEHALSPRARDRGPAGGGVRYLGGNWESGAGCARLAVGAVAV